MISSPVWIGAPWIWGEEGWEREKWLRIERGKIAAILPSGTEGTPKKGDRRWDAVWLSGSALLPTWVNAHAHLELGALRGKLPEAVPMTNWAAALEREISRWGEEEGEIRRRAVVEGAVELLADGVGTVVDIGNSDATFRAVERGETSGLRILFRQELIGRSLKQGEIDRASDRLVDRSGPWDPQTAQPSDDGLSVHAPHTVPLSVIGAVARNSALHRHLFTLHIAEGTEEAEYLSAGTGGWKEWYDAAGLEEKEPVLWRDGWELLAPLLPAGTRTLLIHGNLLGEQSLREIALFGAALVHCPLSHAFFSHPPPPFRTWSRLGIPIALGTDSLASAPSLSMWDNLIRLKQQSALPDETLFRWGTSVGAQAIGLAGVTGVLRPGCSADLQAVDWGGGEGNSAPRLLETAPKVHAVWIAGEERFRLRRAP